MIPDDPDEDEDLQPNPPQIQVTQKPLNIQELDSRLIRKLNMATEKTLVSMPGIGQKRARKIIRSRPFQTIQQVREILPQKLIESARREGRD